MSVWTERTTSTSGMRCAGMKKCRPIMRLCVFSPLPISADREARGVRGQRGLGPRQRLHLGEQSALQREVFGHRLDRDVDLRPVGLGQGGDRSPVPTCRSACPWRPARLASGIGQAVARRGGAGDDIDLPAAARNMAMIPTPIVPPPTTRAWPSWCSRCGIDPPPDPQLDGRPGAGQYRRSLITRRGKQR